MRDMRINTDCPIRPKILTDAAAAKGISNRKGVGQVRHIEVNTLWLQDRVRRGEIIVEKIAGQDNVSDAMTKHASTDSLLVHIKGSSLEFKEGRHLLAPATVEDEMDVLA